MRAPMRRRLISVQQPRCAEDQRARTDGRDVRRLRARFFQELNQFGVEHGRGGNEQMLAAHERRYEQMFESLRRS